MMNRRGMLKLGALGAVSMLQSRLLLAQSARREIRINGKRIKVVDIHAHCGIPAVEPVVRGTPFEMTVGSSRLLGPEWIDWIDQRGIDVQVLSLNQYWWYGADEALAEKITRIQDEGLAEWSDKNRGRFVGLSTVALQHPELAAEQLEYAVTKLGLRGAAIGGHVANEVPTSPRFDPFWAKAEQLGVPVFMHPEGAENVLREDAMEGRGDLGNIIGNPLETTVFLSKLIFDGTLDRFPKLKVCAAHAGGYLPSYLGRTEVACDVREEAECANMKKPSTYLKSQILVDSMVFSDEGLRHLVAEMGVGQVVYGTDRPFNWPDTLDLILNASWISDADKEAILGGNLVRLLKL